MSYTEDINKITTDISTPAPVTYNFLRPTAFRFSIKDLPNVSYTCQAANLPGLQLGTTMQPSPFIDIPIIGDKNTFNDFTIRFIVSEDLSNYKELFEWMIALGFPNDYTQYKGFTGSRLTRFPFHIDIHGGTEFVAYSDGVLTILDSNNKPSHNIILYDMFPVSLAALDFDVTQTTIEYFTCVVSFKYKTFTIEPT